MANGIGVYTPEELLKRRAVLLTCCGVTTYQLIRSLTTPAKPTTKTYVKLVQLVKDHEQPTPSPIVQRYNFNTRVQKPGDYS